jgi:hypothetical protein
VAQSLEMVVLVLLHLFLVLWLSTLEAVVEVIFHQVLLELVELVAVLLVFTTQLLLMEQ